MRIPPTSWYTPPNGQRERWGRAGVDTHCGEKCDEIDTFAVCDQAASDRADYAEFEDVDARSWPRHHTRPGR